jgi:DNA-binding response OmpR family regulator
VARILLVDDDPLVRTSLARALEASGHRVRQADNGARALQALGTAPADVVVVDLVMPEMDGLELIRTVRTRFPETRIVAMSGGCYGKLSYLKTAGDFGAELTFAKPFRPARLAASIDRMMAGATATPAAGNALVS